MKKRSPVLGAVRCGFRTGGWSTSGRLSPKMTRKWRRPNQNRNLDGQAGGHPSVMIRKKWKSTRKRQVTPVPTREYWMIYGGPGFLDVAWCGSSPTPFWQLHIQYMYFLLSGYRREGGYTVKRPILKSSLMRQIAPLEYINILLKRSIPKKPRYLDNLYMTCITRDTVSFSCPGTSGAP